jgi:hypothetical protein
LRTKPIELVLREIMKQYNKVPEGWNVLADHSGNILVMGPDSNFWLRIVPLSPDSYTGVGMEVDRSRRIERIVEGTPPYGLRPLSKSEAKRLLDTFRGKSTSQGKIIEELLSVKPASAQDIQERRPQAIISGPILGHPDLGAISSKQRELERRLAVEADRLFRERYPMRAGIYV